MCRDLENEGVTMNMIKFIISTMCLVATLGLFSSTPALAKSLQPPIEKFSAEFSTMSCIQQSLKELHLDKKKLTLTDIKYNQKLRFVIKKNCKILTSGLCKNPTCCHDKGYAWCPETNCCINSHDDNPVACMFC